MAETCKGLAQPGGPPFSCEPVKMFFGISLAGIVKSRVVQYGASVADFSNPTEATIKESGMRIL